MQVFPTFGDELMLQNACDQAGVRLEIGGITQNNGSIKGFERAAENDSVRGRTDWFVAYLLGEELQIKHAKAIFIQERDRIHVEA
jgi:hypothetical protein